MSNRERNIQIKFRVSAREREVIEKKMALIGTRNMAAYLRKMAMDGKIIRLEVSELKEIDPTATQAALRGWVRKKRY